MLPAQQQDRGGLRFYISREVKCPGAKNIFKNSEVKYKQKCKYYSSSIVSDYERVAQIGCCTFSCKLTNHGKLKYLPSLISGFPLPDVKTLKSGPHDWESHLLAYFKQVPMRRKYSQFEVFSPDKKKRTIYFQFAFDLIFLGMCRFLPFHKGILDIRQAVCFSTI